MDLSTIVNTIQILIWLVIGSTYLWRKGKVRNDGLLKVAIIIGFAMSAFSLVLSYRNGAFPFFHSHSIIVTHSAYLPQSSASLTIISKKTFENQEVPLDGYVYADSTFRNVCLLYNGGAYQLQNVTFKDHIKVCPTDPRLGNYASLMYELKMFKGDVEESERATIPMNK